MKAASLVATMSVGRLSQSESAPGNRVRRSVTRHLKIKTNPKLDSSLFSVAARVKFKSHSRTLQFRTSASQSDSPSSPSSSSSSLSSSPDWPTTSVPSTASSPADDPTADVAAAAAEISIKPFEGVDPLLSFDDAPFRSPAPDWRGTLGTSGLGGVSGSAAVAAGETGGAGVDDALLSFDDTLQPPQEDLSSFLAREEECERNSEGRWEEEEEAGRRVGGDDVFSREQRTRLPKHVAIIMDGNSRWAEQARMPAVIGYERGVESLRRVVKCCVRWGVPVLTVFAFSADNWRRAEAEVSVLLGLMSRVIRQEIPALQQAGIKLHFFGDVDRLPPSLQDDIRVATAATAEGSALTLCVALSYSGRSDVMRAVKQVAERVESGELSAADLDNEDFIQGLWGGDQVLPPEMRDPDLLIRTSGEQRLSDFMLWEMAYTEFYFTRAHWPDFGDKAFEEALLSYIARERRFGSH